MRQVMMLAASSTEISALVRIRLKSHTEKRTVIIFSHGDK